jgi:hypothetical protein
MEGAQIEERLGGFVDALLTSGVDLEPIARGLKKPLRCLWLERNSAGWANGEDDLASLPFTPLLLLQCSRVESETRGIGQRQGWSYIQGAGDDEENWLNVSGIQGFTGEHLTRHQVELMQLDHDEELVERIKDILADEARQRAHAQPADADSATQIHTVDMKNVVILASTSLPSHAAAAELSAVKTLAPFPSSSKSSASASLALLYLYFDASAAVKQQRKTKIAVDHHRAMARTQGHEEDELNARDEMEAESAAADSGGQTRKVDLRDWPSEASLALPVSVSGTAIGACMQLGSLAEADACFLFCVCLFCSR